MHQFKGSPVVGYKIAIVNNADLHNQNKVITPAVIGEDGEVTTPEKTQQQFVWASKRLMRAVRKARTMLGSHKHIQLFGMKKDGTHFPVSLKIRKTAPVVEHVPRLQPRALIRKMHKARRWVMCSLTRFVRIWRGWIGRRFRHDFHEELPAG
jgi:hypothetical protein